MKIVIAGAGEVGTHLGKTPLERDQDIVIIDEDREKLSMLDTTSI